MSDIAFMDANRYCRRTAYTRTHSAVVRTCCRPLPAVDVNHFTPQRHLRTGSHHCRYLALRERCLASPFINTANSFRYRMRATAFCGTVSRVTLPTLLLRASTIYPICLTRMGLTNSSCMPGVLAATTTSARTLPWRYARHHSIVFGELLARKTLIFYHTALLTSCCARHSYRIN